MGYCVDSRARQAKQENCASHMMARRSDFCCAFGEDGHALMADGVSGRGQTSALRLGGPSRVSLTDMLVSSFTRLSAETCFDTAQGHFQAMGKVERPCRLSYGNTAGLSSPYSRIACSGRQILVESLLLGPPRVHFSCIAWCSSLLEKGRGLGSTVPKLTDSVERSRRPFRASHVTKGRWVRGLVAGWCVLDDASGGWSSRFGHVGGGRGRAACKQCVGEANGQASNQWQGQHEAEGRPGQRKRRGNGAHSTGNGPRHHGRSPRLNGSGGFRRSPRPSLAGARSWIMSEATAFSC
ncbi:hypothetical protein BS50DRAFT_393709 [Corynespora cassiicola Philippines]|uniref:Uncharacterized protein n=1 Tax=Corynespora cassiicola Philippines TaxID=1448308 RepID=A0A2T2NQ24_CORCC|nr:hypothetical protein BS50DRAFT_393709 [Corynespora cassiicola Philippines]